MRAEDKEIIKLTAKEALKTIFDLPEKLLIACEGNKKGFNFNRIMDYCIDRDIEKDSFKEKLKYLKKRKLINTFIEGKEKYLEMTKEGYEAINKDLFFSLQIERPSKWDGLFRIVIFDIPEDHKSVRDGIRRKLDQIGFIQIQKSVFAYPFECKVEIDLLKDWFGTKGWLKYMIVNIIEGEADIIDQFLDKKVLEKSDMAVVKETKTS